jgi:hypothetical protein
MQQGGLSGAFEPMMETIFPFGISMASVFWHMCQMAIV